MKKILVIFVFTCCIITPDNASAQTTQNHFLIEMERTAPDNAGDQLHKLANNFAKLIGDTLKALYPATVTDVDVFMNEGPNGITLSYRAIVSRCEPYEAIYYFDHRGALSGNNKFDLAEKDAKERAFEQTMEANKKFAESYGAPYHTWFRYAQIRTKKAETKYIYLAENFIGAGPKK